MLNRLLENLGLASHASAQRDFLLEMLPKDSIGAEIGVHTGDFSERILRKVQPKKLHLIDPWKFEPGEEYKKAWYGGKAGSQEAMDRRCDGVKTRFKAGIERGQVQIDRGFSTDILQRFADSYLDWIYIDGNHLYEFVKQDLELSLRKTRPGGLITGDDYEEGGYWQGGVKKAVDEFSRTRSMQVLAIRDRQFVLRSPLRAL